MTLHRKFGISEMDPKIPSRIFTSCQPNLWLLLFMADQLHQRKGIVVIFLSGIVAIGKAIKSGAITKSSKINVFINPTLPEEEA